MQLQIGEDGNARPLTCPDGDLNVVAWNYFAKGNPPVMSIGRAANESEVLQAMCADRNTTNPIELSRYHLAALYYGWHFGADVASKYLTGCSGAQDENGSTTGGVFVPTPEEVTKAKQALAFCQHAHPGTTLQELEKEAAAPLGIQC